MVRRAPRPSRDVLSDTTVAYFVELGWDDDEASELHHKYYTQYGLALRGLVRHNQVGETFRLNSNHIGP